MSPPVCDSRGEGRIWRHVSQTGGDTCRAPVYRQNEQTGGRHVSQTGGNTYLHLCATLKTMEQAGTRVADWCRHVSRASVRLKRAARVADRRELVSCAGLQSKRVIRRADTCRIQAWTRVARRSTVKTSDQASRHVSQTGVDTCRAPVYSQNE